MATRANTIATMALLAVAQAISAVAQNTSDVTFTNHLYATPGCSGDPFDTQTQLVKSRTCMILSHNAGHIGNMRSTTTCDTTGGTHIVSHACSDENCENDCTPDSTSTYPVGEYEKWNAGECAMMTWTRTGTNADGPHTFYTKVTSDTPGIMPMATYGNPCDTPSMTCGDIKEAYQSQSCCGNPNKPFTVPSSRRLAAASEVDMLLADIRTAVMETMARSSTEAGSLKQRLLTVLASAEKRLSE